MKQRRLYAGLMMMVVLSLFLTGCQGRETDKPEKMEAPLPPFPESAPQQVAEEPVAEEPVISEPDLVAEDEVDIGDVI